MKATATYSFRKGTDELTLTLVIDGKEHTASCPAPKKEPGENLTLEIIIPDNP